MVSTVFERSFFFVKEKEITHGFHMEKNIKKKARNGILKAFLFTLYLQLSFSHKSLYCVCFILITFSNHVLSESLCSTKAYPYCIHFVFSSFKCVLKET